MQRVVILGAGFGGLYTARALSLARGGAVHVTLVDQRDRFLFKPLLYELLTDEVDEDDIAPRLDRVAAHPRITRIQARVRGVDLEGRRVMLEGGGPAVLAYDQLVIALGVQPGTGLIPGARAHGLPLTTLDHVYAVRHRLEERLSRPEAQRSAGQTPTRQSEALRTVAIVGAGPAGVETALKLADRFHRERLRCVLVEASSGILPRFALATRRAVRRALHHKGVELRTETPVARVEAWGVEFAGGERLAAETVIVTAGGRPGPAIACLDTPRDARGRLVVDPKLELPGLAGVFAIGDNASIYDPRGAAPPPETAQAAIQEAAIVAQNVLARARGGALTRFRYRELGETLSLGSGSALLRVGPIAATGRAASVLCRALYLYRMPGTQHRVIVGARWAARLLGGLASGALPRVAARLRARETT